MSQSKLFCNTCLWSGCVCDGHIRPNCVINCGDILKEMHDQLFVDDNLSYDQCMFLLNHRNSIQGRFIDVITDRIRNLNISDNIRQVCLDNVDKFSRHLIHEHSDANVNFGPFRLDDDDDESHEDYLIDDPNLNDHEGSGDDNDDDDLENMIIDEYEAEHYFNLYRINIVNADDNDLNENNDDYGHGWTCLCVECYPEPKLDDID
jgi:hypothetical protein